MQAEWTVGFVGAGVSKTYESATLAVDFLTGKYGPI